MKSYNFYILFISLLMFYESHSQWITEIVHPPGVTLEYVTIVDSASACAIGHNSLADTSILLIRTHKDPWFRHYLQIANNNGFTCVASLDRDRIWLGTNTGKVYFHSYELNQTVLQIDVGGQGYINDIKFSRQNPNYGYVYSDRPGGPGTPFRIYKTSNAGQNWTELSPVFGGSYVGATSMCVTDSDHVWLGLNCQPSGCQVPKVAYTTNGGLNWLVTTIPNGSNYVSSVTFKIDNNYGIVAPWDQVPTRIYKSTNGGSLWSFLLNTPNQFPVNNITWINGTATWYYSTEDDLNHIFKSSNDGLNWQPMTVPAGTDQVTSMDLVRNGDKTYGYAVTLNGRILRLIDTVNIIGIQPVNNQIPNNFSLKQNYPNPFNPATNISYSLPEASQVKLVIFDMLGRELGILINGKISAGIHELEWDASAYPSGVYFYKITAGDFTAVKKMILLK